MKKMLIVIVGLGVLLAGGFMLLLAQTSPDNAPQGEVIRDLTPSQSD